ncbi:hypothetical protein, partial [Algoriphagus sp.]|uniref:hypothetical protein n=1 Tax=Algoriphagus sp. TaxID=1872435 RepID=UPI003F6FA2A2
SIIFSTACVGLIPPLQGTLMSIRNYVSHLRSFAGLVGRPMTPAFRQAGKTEAVSRFTISYVAFDYLLSGKRIYILFKIWIENSWTESNLIVRFFIGFPAQFREITSH